MSRKGKQPIALPKGVEVKVNNKEVTVKGPKGSLKQAIPDGIVIETEKDQILVGLSEGFEDLGNFHGLFRSLVQNMVLGTTQGFERVLEMVGVGYRAAVQGKKLDLQVGFSHPTQVPIPEGVAVTVDKGTVILIKGMDKQVIGQFAASVRAKRPPEVYQGKGIRYSGEYVRKKAGKAAATKK